MEEEFRQLDNIYYDPNGKVYDLIKVSDTHFVALKDEGGLEYVENHIA